MGSCFVTPQLVRLTLSQGNWIDVHHELTIGQQNAMFAAMRRQFGAGEVPVLDPTRIGRSRALAYIVNWSLTDPAGNPVPLSAAAFDNLKIPVAQEIRDTLEAHEERVVEEREAEKNAADGALSSGPISPSVR